MRQDIQDLLNENPCKEGDVFSYNANSKVITYMPGELDNNIGMLALLHEIAHYKLDHFSYKYDIELLDMEVNAWGLTRSLAKKYHVAIEEEHIEECLDSYDKWISKRATCPKCGTYSLQRAKSVFGCFVCDCIWKVNENKTKEIRKKVIECANRNQSDLLRSFLLLLSTFSFKIIV